MSVLLTHPFMADCFKGTIFPNVSVKKIEYSYRVGGTGFMADIYRWHNLTPSPAKKAAQETFTQTYPGQLVVNYTLACT